MARISSAPVNKDDRRSAVNWPGRSHDLDKEESREAPAIHTDEVCVKVILEITKQANTEIISRVAKTW